MLNDNLQDLVQGLQGSSFIIKFGELTNAFAVLMDNIVLNERTDADKYGAVFKVVNFMFL